MEVSVIISVVSTHNTLTSVENAQESECCQRKDVFSCNANSINNTKVTEIKVPSCCWIQCHCCSIVSGEGPLLINKPRWGRKFIRGLDTGTTRFIVHFPLKYLEFSTLV